MAQAAAGLLERLKCAYAEILRRGVWSGSLEMARPSRELTKRGFHSCTLATKLLESPRTPDAGILESHYALPRPLGRLYWMSVSIRSSTTCRP